MVQIAERKAPSPSDARSRRHDIATVFFGLWMATALYIDGWSHLNDEPETFFSPWHVMLYSGFGTAVAYFAVEDMRQRRSGARSIDGIGVLGLALFAVAGVADFLWHEIFGVEADLETLLSPSHLGLLASGVLIFSTPFRSAWKRGGEQEPSFRSFLPALLSITLSTAVTSFFLSYLSAFRVPALLLHSNVALLFLHQLQVIGSVLITNVLLLVPTLLVLRRWRPPLGSFTILYSTIGISMVAIDSFRWPRLAIPAVVGGVLADLIVRVAGSRSPSATTRLIAGLVPAGMWCAWVAAVEATLGVYWSPELVWGTVALAGLMGLVLSILAFPMKIRPAEVVSSSSLL
jgi:hypothetical protein